MPISLSPDATKQLLASIKQFSAEHLDEELGELKASLFLEFCVAEVGAVVYNQAIADAQERLQVRVTELDIECHADEFGYWRKFDPPRRR